MKIEHGFRSLRNATQVPFNGYGVAQWCPNDDGVNPTEVHLHFIWDTMPEIVPVMRLKSMRAVNELIEILQQHSKEVFGEAEGEKSCA